jgi:hypothetical protein
MGQTDKNMASGSGLIRYLIHDYSYLTQLSLKSTFALQKNDKQKAECYSSK